MKYLKPKFIGTALVLLFIMAACKKESQNIFNMFDVKLELLTPHPFSSGEYKEINDGDTVFLDYTITSPTKDMYQVAIAKASGGLGFHNILLAESERRSYTGRDTLVATATANTDRSKPLTYRIENAGMNSYRIWAYDKEGVFIGDGYKRVSIYVKPNFTHIANRNIFYPDSLNKSTNNYFSLTKGETFNYAGAQANSADIDFGIYRKPTATPNTYTTHIYSLSESPLPYTVDDISSFTKRQTLFSAPVASHAATFNNTLTIGNQIEAQAKTRTINLKSISATIPAGSVVYFRTPEGKYGAILFNAITTNYSGAPFVNVSVKYQN